MTVRFAHLKLPIFALAVAALALLAPGLVQSPVAVAGSAFTVNTTDDVDDATCDVTHCSLHEAINAANDNTEPDTIEFDIPSSQCDIDGVCTIGVASFLPGLSDDGTIIDGYTQPGASQNTNDFGHPINAAIKIEVANAADVSLGLRVGSAGNTIRGLAIYDFQVAIRLFSDSAQNNVIEGNFIGVTASGADTAASGDGINVTSTSGALKGPSTNVIGGSDPSSRNLISGNSSFGVFIGSSRDSIVQGNYIGTDVSGVAPMPNGVGVSIDDSGHGQQSVSQGHLVAENLIAFNAMQGVDVEQSDGLVSGITVTENSIHSNEFGGIRVTGGANEGIAPPVITATGSASGTACANCTVEVFSDDADQGGTFEGSTVADGNGDWSFPGAVTGPNITATATDASGNTSEFSTPFSVVDLIQGDNDCDNDADSVDALKGLQHVAAIDFSQEPDCPTLGSALPAALPAGAAPDLFGDVDCDDDVDSVDALKILRSVAAFSVTQNEPCTDIGDPL